MTTERNDFVPDSIDNELKLILRDFAGETLSVVNYLDPEDAKAIMGVLAAYIISMDASEDVD